jgi:DNA-binding NarL/FixJ family response regulator
MRPFIIADNQDLTKAGWIYLINKHYPNASQIEVLQKKELMQTCAENPDGIILLDYNLFDFENVSEVVFLQEKYAKTNWIICSDTINEEAVRSFLFGSSRISILKKDSDAEEFISALKQASKGDRYISSYISNMLLDAGKTRNAIAQSRNVLTQTEQEILREMAMGKSTREIAEIRHASIHTIMTHRKNIFRKIEVNNVHEATRYAMRAGLIDMAEYYI